MRLLMLLFASSRSPERIACVGHTTSHARRIEITFRRGATIGIDVERVIRARLHARLTADAALVIEVNDAVGAAKQRHRRANLDARRVVAVIAAQHRKVASGVWIDTLLDVFDPGPVNSHRDVMFFLTGNRAGMTADAAMLIDEKSVTHYKPFRSTNLAIYRK